MMRTCGFNVRRVCVPPAASVGPSGAKRSCIQISANRYRTLGSSRWGSLDGLAAKSSLPCPGEEALPRPESLVGVGTWGGYK